MPFTTTSNTPTAKGSSQQSLLHRLQNLENKVDRILQLLEELAQACFEDPDSDADSSVDAPLSDGVE